MLKISDEYQSFRRTLKSEDSLPVLALSMQYSESELNLQVELIDTAYYRENKEEVGRIVSVFISEMNQKLDFAGMPLIKEAELLGADNG